MTNYNEVEVKLSNLDGHKRIAAYKPGLLKNKPLIDLLQRINPRSESDIAILETWKKHLQAVDSPYIVCLHNKNIKLWKLQRRKPVCRNFP